MKHRNKSMHQGWGVAQQNAFLASTGMDLLSSCTHACMHMCVHAHTQRMCTNLKANQKTDSPYLISNTK